MKMKRRLFSLLMTFALVFSSLTLPTTVSAAEGDTLVVCGGFNGWNNADGTNVITSDADGVYTGTITIPADYEESTTDLQIVTSSTWDKSSAGLNGALPVGGNVVGVVAGQTIDVEYDSVTHNLTLTGDGYVSESSVPYSVHVAVDSELGWDTVRLNGWNFETNDFSALTNDDSCNMTANGNYYDMTFYTSQNAGDTNVNLQPYCGDDWTAGIVVNVVDYTECWINVASDKALSVVYVEPSEDEEATPTPDVSEEPSATVEATVEPEETEDSGDADTLIVHIENSLSWEELALHHWGQIGETQWPGTVLTEDEDNPNYFTYAVELANLEDEVGLLPNNNNNGEQTVDIKNGADQLLGEFVSGENEYWITILDEVDGSGHYNVDVSQDAPDGWVDSDVEVATAAPTATATATAEAEDEDASDTTTDGSADVVVHFEDSADWGKVGAYICDSDWGELTGAWPGTEMTLDGDSETWYEIGVSTDAEAFNMVFNNLPGEGEDAYQTQNLEGVSTGEFWVTLGEADSEGKYSFTVAEEAPDSYDGDGWTAEDEGTTSVADGSSSPDTGDSAPIIPIAIIAIASIGTVVVVRRKKMAL